MRVHSLLPTVLVSLALLGAAPQAAAWKLADAGTPPAVSTKGEYQLKIPSNWKYDTGGGDVVASLMGMRLGIIVVDWRKHKKAFPGLKKDSRPDATPEELAEDFIADFRKNSGDTEVEMLSNEPAELGGKPAFRMVIAYRNAVDKGAVRMRQVVIGTATPKGVVFLTYRAPVLHWYDYQLPAFEEAAKGFVFGLPPPAPKKR